MLVFMITFLKFFVKLEQDLQELQDYVSRSRIAVCQPNSVTNNINDKIIHQARQTSSCKSGAGFTGFTGLGF